MDRETSYCSGMTYMFFVAVELLLSHLTSCKGMRWHRLWQEDRQRCVYFRAKTFRELDTSSVKGASPTEWRLAMSVCPLPFSKGVRAIAGETGAFTLHVVATLGQLFAGETVLVCGLETSVQSNGKKQQPKYSKRRSWSFVAFACRVQ